MNERSIYKLEKDSHMINEELQRAERLLEATDGEVTLASGDVVEFGSERHVADLQRSISELEVWRNRERRGTERRATYARAIRNLKHQLASAERVAFDIHEGFDKFMDRIVVDEARTVEASGGDAPMRRLAKMHREHPHNRITFGGSK